MRGVLRDHRGMVKGGFLFNIGRGDCFLTERWAVLMGLKWSWDFGVRHLVLKSDCLELVQEIERHRDYNEDVLAHMRLSELKEEIVSFFNRACDLQVVWCRREENEVADCLAKHALKMGVGLVNFEKIPVEAADRVMKDLALALS